MSTTSSTGRRPPKGQPALSPPSGPRRFWLASGVGANGQIDARDIGNEHAQQIVARSGRNLQAEHAVQNAAERRTDRR